MSLSYQKPLWSISLPFPFSSATFADVVVTHYTHPETPFLNPGQVFTFCLKYLFLMLSPSHFEYHQNKSLLYCGISMLKLTRKGYDGKKGEL